MKNVMTKEISGLKKYIQPHREYIWMIGIWLVFTIPVPHPAGAGTSYIVFILATGLALGGIPFICEYIMYIITLRKLYHSGVLQNVASDYTSSKSYMNGRIMLGKKYLFCKNSSNIIYYKQISDLYFDSAFPDDKILRLKLTDGKKRIILRIRGFSHNRYKDESLKMIQAILDGNASIRFNDMIGEA